MTADSPARTTAGRRPRIQLALDFPAALGCVESVREWIDVVEVGTPLLKRFGLAAVSTVRDLAPGMQVLADAKTVDGGAAESEMLFDAGADVVTVLAVASSSTFDAVDRVARRRSAQVIADTIVSPDPFAALAEDYPSTVTGVALHVPHDQRAAGTASAGSLVASVLPAPLGRDLVLAGGIDLASLDLLLALEPDVLVVGRAITAAPDPVAAARAIAERVR